MGLFDFFRRLPTHDAFAQIVLQQIRQQGLAPDCRYEADQFRLLAGSQILNLDNAYRDYCAAPRKDRAQVVQKYLSIFSMSEVPSGFAEARSALMPVLRNRSQGDYLRLLALREPQRPVLAQACQALGEDAVIMLAWDTESAMAIIGQNHLDQWGVTFDTALAVAIDNLRARTQHQFLPLGNGLLLGEWDDAYDSSRLLLPDLLYRACEGGEPLVMVPTRGRMLLASSNNLAGQLAMVALADKLAQEEGRLVSSLMYGVRQGKIVVHQPTDTAVAQALLGFQSMLCAHYYKEQKDEWDQSNQSTGDDIFIASCMLKQPEGSERVVTLSAWTQGVDTLLPRTDIVAMVIPDNDDVADSGSVKMLAWQDALDVGGHLMQEIDCYPVRYRVRDFPDSQQLAAAPAWE